MKAYSLTLALSCIAASLIGCGSAADQSIPTAMTPIAFDGTKYVLADEPDGAIGVISARESTSDGESVVIVGRVGGAASPWVEGRAAFTILDASKSIVAEGTDSGNGELCTGDCCAVERAECTMLVKVVDETGRVLAVDARQAFGLAADDMVVVRGKVSKDESGNVALLADGVHIRR